MRDERKWQLAVAEFKATRANVPGLVSEAFVNEFHAVLDRMAAASEEDFDTFRIPAADLKPRVVSSQRKSQRGRQGLTQYGREKFCDRNLFQRKIDGLEAYLPIVEEKLRELLVSDDSKDYWSMDDAKLSVLDSYRDDEQLAGKSECGAKRLRSLSDVLNYIKNESEVYYIRLAHRLLWKVERIPSRCINLSLSKERIHSDPLHQPNTRTLSK
jgi:hypothetical protein